MAANPRIVTEDRQIFWDGVQQRLPKGQQIDVPPGSALEREIGAEFLVPLPGAPVQEAVPAAAVAQGGGGGGGHASALEVPPAAPPKSRAAAKSGDGKDGEP